MTKNAYVITDARLVLADAVLESPLSIIDEHIGESERYDDWCLSLKHHLIFPGLINAHDHLHLNSLQLPPLGRTFANSYQWIKYVLPYIQTAEIKAKLQHSKPARYWQGGLKNILSGVTTVVHHDPWSEVFSDPDFPVRVLRDYDWCHSPGLAGRYGPDLWQAPKESADHRLRMIHLAEGTDIIAATELLSLIDYLDDKTLLIHCVGLSDAGIERVIKKGIGVVWCPASNIKLLGKTLTPDKLYERQRLALGTDSRLSGSQDMLSELKVAAACSTLTAKQLLHLIGEMASKLLSMSFIGGLYPSQSADYVIIRDTGSDPYASLVQTNRAQLRAVVKSGYPMIADPDFADWFHRLGMATITVSLDGQSKLMAAPIAKKAAVALEPGLEYE